MLIRRKQLHSDIFQADFVVDTATQLQDALDSIGVSGIGASICLKRGTYTPATFFFIPRVSNISIFSHGGTVLQKVQSYPLFQFETATSGAQRVSNFQFYNLRMTADGTTDSSAFFEQNVSGRPWNEKVLIESCILEEGYGGVAEFAFNKFTLLGCLVSRTKTATLFRPNYGFISEMDMWNTVFDLYEAPSPMIFDQTFSPVANQGRFSFRENRITYNAAPTYAINLRAGSHKLFPQRIYDNIFDFPNGVGGLAYIINIDDDSKFYGRLSNNIIYGTNNESLITNIKFANDRALVYHNDAVIQL